MILGCLGVSLGSSPLARGTQSSPASPVAAGGLIPARAGNTHSVYRAGGNAGAHPRSRGEHLSRFLMRLRISGSSPLARGTRGKIKHAVAWAGLIPARAGNTPAGAAASAGGGAHPRSRGEHLPVIPNAARAAGSSPLARGTLSGWVACTVAGGLIPARAGNTLLRE